MGKRLAGRALWALLALPGARGTAGEEHLLEPPKEGGSAAGRSGWTLANCWARLICATAQWWPQKSEDMSQAFWVKPVRPASPKASGQLCVELQVSQPCSAEVSIFFSSSQSSDLELSSFWGAAICSPGPPALCSPCDGVPHIVHGSCWSFPLLFPRATWQTVTCCPEQDNIMKPDVSLENRSPQWAVPQFPQLSKED